MEDPSAPGRFSRPAAARKVGAMSMPETKCFSSRVLGFAWPGQRTIQGVAFEAR